MIVRHFGVIGPRFKHDLRSTAQACGQELIRPRLEHLPRPAILLYETFLAASPEFIPKRMAYFARDALRISAVLDEDAWAQASQDDRTRMYVEGLISGLKDCRHRELTRPLIEALTRDPPLTER